MSATKSTTSNAAQQLSARALGTYGHDWALFTDWCQSTGDWELPADPGTVLRFLRECPAAVGTQRVRVAAIDHHHAIAGYPRPGEDPGVRAALGSVLEHAAAPGMSEQVAAAMRGLPSHGWTRGVFGRRDRCLLVLSQLGGVPYKHLAILAAGDVTLAGGTARIESTTGAWMVAPHEDPVLCGSCAITRWLRALNLIVTRPSNRDIAQSLKKAKPVTSGSPHLCRSERTLDPATLVVSVLPPIDQWGYIPFPVQRLTPHSLSRRARDLMDGDLGAHRNLPADTDDERPETSAQVPPPAPRAVYTKADAQRAWARRRADLADIAEVDDILNDVDVRAKELQQRTAAILVAATDAEPLFRGEL